jgi:hypothetical protein
MAHDIESELIDSVKRYVVTTFAISRSICYCALVLISV